MRMQKLSSKKVIKFMVFLLDILLATCYLAVMERKTRQTTRSKTMGNKIMDFKFYHTKVHSIIKNGKKYYFGYYKGDGDDCATPLCPSEKELQQWVKENAVTLTLAYR